MNPITKVENFNQIEKNLLSYPNTILFINIRSLRLNFTSFLASIHKIVNKINFIALVETNITDDETNIYNINGFCSHFVNREGRGGGVALYIRENIAHSKIDINTSSFESLQYDVEINNNISSLIVVYRPPKNKTNECLKN